MNVVSMLIDNLIPFLCLLIPFSVLFFFLFFLLFFLLKVVTYSSFFFRLSTRTHYTNPTFNTSRFYQVPDDEKLGSQGPSTTATNHSARHVISSRQPVLSSTQHVEGMCR